LVDAHEIFSKDPGDIVFFESPSALLGSDGKPVTKWF
jgi:hypothetical protein